jgi:O-antigen ligase
MHVAKRRNRSRGSRSARSALLLLSIVFIKPVVASLTGLVVPYRLDDVALIAVLSMATIGRFKSTAPAFTRLWPFMVLFVLSAGGYLINGSALAPAIQPTARTIAFATAQLLALTMFITSRNTEELKYVWQKLHILLGAVALVVAMGAFAEIVKGGFSELATIRVGYGREHPATLGYISALLAVLVYYNFATVCKRNAFLRVASLGIFGCLLVTLYLSQTRGAWLTFVLAFAILMTLSGNWRAMIALAAGLLMVVSTLPLMDRTNTELSAVIVDNTQTLEGLGSGRLGFWRIFWEEASLVSPIIGGGVGHAFQTSTQHGNLLAGFGYSQYVAVHNDFLLMYMDFGALGIVSYCCGMLWPLWSRRKRCGDLERALAAGVCVASFVDNFFFMFPAIFILVAVLEIRRSLHSAMLPVAVRISRPYRRPFALRQIAG